MRPFLWVSLRRFLSVWGGCALLALVMQGCGSKPEEATAGATASSTLGTATPGTTANNQSSTAPPANASDADMRKSFDQKTFDINQVPAKDRERVRGMMQQSAPSAPSAGK